MLKLLRCITFSSLIFSDPICSFKSSSFRLTTSLKVNIWKQVIFQNYTKKTQHKHFTAPQAAGRRESVCSFLLDLFLDWTRFTPPTHTDTQPTTPPAHRHTPSTHPHYTNTDLALALWERGGASGERGGALGEGGASSQQEDRLSHTHTWSKVREWRWMLRPSVSVRPPLSCPHSLSDEAASHRLILALSLWMSQKNRAGLSCGDSPPSSSSSDFRQESSGGAAPHRDILRCFLEVIFFQVL